MAAENPDLRWFVAQLERSAEAVSRGAELEPLPEHGHPEARAMSVAFNSVVRALAARERERPDRTEVNVLLALEELAKEQAAELAEQNEQLRRHKVALEHQNRVLQHKNEELLRVGRLKDEFLATMSHELRTPLSSIIGYSEMLLEEIAGPLTAEQGSYVGDVMRSGRHLLDIINDILDMAKVDAGRMDFHRVRVDLSQVVAEAADIARSMALRKHQRLELTHDPDVHCAGDGQRIRQIALNLLSNAVKFTPEGGSIAVLVRRAGDAAELVVKDAGIGIDPAHHELIFEAFRQVDGSNTREHQGTGLGLTLVRKFCTAMGGTVSVSSRTGEGATFTVRLPLFSIPGAGPVSTGGPGVGDPA